MIIVSSVTNEREPFILVVLHCGKIRFNPLWKLSIPWSHFYHQVKLLTLGLELGSDIFLYSISRKNLIWHTLMRKIWRSSLNFSVIKMILSYVVTAQTEKLKLIKQKCIFPLTLEKYYRSLRSRNTIIGSVRYWYFRN